MTGTPGTTITQPSPSHNASRPNSPSPADAAAAALSAKCISITELYRLSTINKAIAILRICTELGSASLAEDDYAKALQSYLDMLDQYELAASRARSLGTVAAPGDVANASGDRGSQGIRVEVEGQGPARGEKRKRGEEDSSDEDGDGEEPAPGDYPWIAEHAANPVALSPLLVATRKQIKRWSEIGVKRVLEALRNADRRPEFPDSEWKSIILGACINLDKVFSSLNSDHIDTRHSAKVGPLEFSVDDRPAIKQVFDANSWGIAWNATSVAITFTSRHRAPEVDGYRQHITQLFFALDSGMHGGIIKYDRAARNRVAQRNDLLLTDFPAFGDLMLSFTSSSGAQAKMVVAPDARVGSFGDTGFSLDPCRKWNFGSCTNTADGPTKCRYRHVCLHCRDDHVFGKCPQASKQK